MSRRIGYGALAALFAALVGVQAFFERTHYPLATKLFDGDYQIAVNCGYALCIAGAAVFGYLAANTKGNGNA